MSLRGTSVHLVDSIEVANEVFSWLGTVKSGKIAFDTESSGLSWETDKVRLVQISDAKTAFAIPFERWGGVFEDVVKRWDGLFIGHNAPFDVAMLANAGIDMPIRRIDDTRLKGHVLDSTESTALKFQASKYVDRNAARFQHQLDDYMTEKGWTWATIPIVSEGEAAIYWHYGGLDPLLTYQLDDRHDPLVKSRSPKAYELELDTAWVVSKMKRNGARVDQEYTRKKYDDIGNYVNQAREWCISNYGVRPGSNAKVAEILIQEGWEDFLRATTKTGAIQLTDKVLSSIAHPLTAMVSNYRKAQKVQSTFLARFLEYSTYDGRLHPNINSVGGSSKSEGESGGEAGVRTARMSMDTPNLQQLSKPGKKGNPFAAVVRNCIVPSEGNEIITCDFDQIEMRILAHLSKDPSLIEAFHTPGDFFTTLTQTMHNDPSITKDDYRRNTTKTLSYGKIFGSGIDTFARSSGLATHEAREAYALFNRMFPGANALARQVKEEVLSTRANSGTGYVCSPLTGRRFIVNEEREYSLMNHLIQGTAAEFFKSKLVAADNAGLSDYMILPVHDEIVSDVPKEMAEEFMATLQDVMTDTKTFDVPMTAGFARGDRWGTKKDVD